MRRAETVMAVARRALGIVALTLFVVSSVDAGELVNLKDGMTYGNTIPICVLPDNWNSASRQPIVEARANISGHDYYLSYGQCNVLIPPAWLVPGYGANIDISGYPRGSYDVGVLLRDMGGQEFSGRFAMTKDAPPALTVSSPQGNNVIANKSFLIEASCEDDSYAPCQITVNVNSMPVYSGSSYLKKTISCDGYSGATSLSIVAEDGRTASSINKILYCVDNPSFEFSAAIPSAIIGYDHGKAIFFEEGANSRTLKYFNISSGVVEKELSFSKNPGGAYAESGFVMAGNGVAYMLRTSDSKYQVMYWDGGEVAAIGEPVPIGEVYNQQFKLAGSSSLVKWSYGVLSTAVTDFLFVYDTDKNEIVVQASGIAIPHALKEDTFVYEVNSELFMYRKGNTSKLKSIPQGVYVVDLSTDGNLVTYKIGSDFFVHDGEREVLLVPSALRFAGAGKMDDLVDGRVVYWKRNDGGQNNALTQTADLWMWDKAKGARILVFGSLAKSLIDLQRDGWVFFRASPSGVFAYKEGAGYKPIPDYGLGDSYIYDGRDTYLQLFNSLFRFTAGQACNPTPSMILRMVPSILRAVPHLPSHSARQQDQ